MDSISVQLKPVVSNPGVRRYRINETYCDIKNVHSDTTHVLLTAHTLLGSPLEGSNTRILDFVQVLHTLGDINEQVGTSSVRSETPDLPGIGDIPSELIGKNTSSSLEIVTSVDFAGLDGQRELLINGEGLDEQTIVLVLRFRESNNR